MDNSGRRSKTWTDLTVWVSSRRRRRRRRCTPEFCCRTFAWSTALTNRFGSGTLSPVLPLSIVMNSWYKWELVLFMLAALASPKTKRRGVHPRALFSATSTGRGSSKVSTGVRPPVPGDSANIITANDRPTQEPQKYFLMPPSNLLALYGDIGILVYFIP